MKYIQDLDWQQTINSCVFTFRFECFPQLTLHWNYDSGPYFYYGPLRRKKTMGFCFYIVTFGLGYYLYIYQTHEFCVDLFATWRNDKSLVNCSYCSPTRQRGVFTL